MRELAGVESGQGVLFLVRPDEPELPARVDENCALFDRIQDPGNVGTLLRAPARRPASSGCSCPPARRPHGRPRC